MMRNWLLGIFVIGLTVFCLFRAYFGPVEAVSGESSAGLLIAGEPGADLLSVTPLQGLHDADAGTGTRELAAEDSEEETGEPSAEVPASPPPPSAAVAAQPGERLVFTLDVPGGASEEDREQARREAASYILEANRSQDSPMAVAKLLTLAIRSQGLEPDEELDAYEKLQTVNRHGLLNPRNDEECFRVTVGRGDSLWKICRQLQSEGHAPVAAGLVKLVNGMSSDSIYEGQRLKVPSQPLSIRVEKSRFRLDVFVGDVLIRRYPICIGRADTPTPEGVFSIKTREEKPTWYKPGVGPLEFGHPENVLGTRWLGFKELPDFPNASTFGIHGTWEDDTIGAQHSNGCIRMLNADVEELFDWVPEGTRVEIVP